MFAISLAMALVAQEVPLSGTQPNTLMVPPEPSSRCGCHFDYAGDRMDEPGQSYRASPMALAALDPLFRAALEVAHRDEPRLSPTCLRCHAPAGWLAGRSEPGDGSALLPEDLEGVTCDVCHRMVPATPALIGDGQYTLADDPKKRATRGNGPANGHAVEGSRYTGSSELCGVCHSLFNPLESAHDAAGRDLGFRYYEQRTYEEWRDSTVKNEKGCVDCHMGRARGFACAERQNEYPDLAVHTLVGGNTFLPRAVALLYPDLDLGPEAAEIVRLTRAKLAEAARLEIISPRGDVASGDALELRVRLTNLTGHKLPTGYPEGRRVYLELTLAIEGRTPELISGRWDPRTGNLEDDPQLRTYETAHGRAGEGRTMHLARANQILSDTRIPPAGFRPRHADMMPEGRDYGSAPYRHFDEHTYRVPIPAGLETRSATVTVRAMYQVTSGRYVDFLVEQLGRANPRAQELERAFAVLDRARPELMTEVRRGFRITKRVDPPDAGFVDVGFEDAAAPDATMSMPPPPGCACDARASTRAWWALGLLALLGLRRR